MTDEKQIFIVKDATDNSTLCETFDEALKTLKANPMSRMKKFKNKEEALSFSELQTEWGTPTKTHEHAPPSGDFSPSLINSKIFPTPLPKEFAKLRRLIESKKPENMSEIRELIWDNPKYLVSVCDTATVLMAGPKYNAAHIAAKSGANAALKFMLQTVSDYKFFRKLYPHDSIDTVQDALQHTLDSYLNTPDPKQGFTPLHWACRSGHAEVVKTLLSFKETDITLRDIRGKTAHDIILEQEEKADARKQNIEELFLIANLTNLTINSSPILTKQKD